MGEPPAEGAPPTEGSTFPPLYLTHQQRADVRTLLTQMLMLAADRREVPFMPGELRARLEELEELFKRWRT